MRVTVGAALHNAVRRFCLDRTEAYESVYRAHSRASEAAFLRNVMPDATEQQMAVALRRFGLADALLPEEVPFPPEAEAQALPDRVQMLQAILAEVETYRPEHLKGPERGRALLCLAGERAAVWGAQSYTGPDGPVHRELPNWTAHQQAQVEDERASFLTFVATVSEEEAASMALAPYRHFLTPSERERVRTRLRKRWGVDPRDHYWFPLDDRFVSGEQSVLAVQDAYFHLEVGVAALKDLLGRRKVRRVWQVEESLLSPDLEQDPHWCTFHQTGGETYWTAPKLDWLIYASHERSLTFAGEWLVPAVKRLWPNWEQRIYDGHGYE
jgi:hypothetical protein